jgi:hypothetical protein
MTSISKFDSEIYSEELHQVSEAEHDEVMQLMAQDDFEGYSEWSSDIEEAAWTGAQSFNEVLIKRACEHSGCDFFRCEKNLRVAGIEI